MTPRLCERCEFFNPAHTCIEKPTWGHCTKLIQAKPEWGTVKLRPMFTWADSHCDGFQTRQSAAVRR